jgi:aspartate ammonia-lyase
MEPVIALNIMQSMRLLAKGMDSLRSRCVDGIEADEQRCRALHDGSLVLAATLNPFVGYARAATLARAALAEGMALRDVVERDSGLSAAQIELIFGADTAEGPGPVQH